MEVDYEYQTDYAKSGRSCCTKCRENIGQGTLRIGKLIQAANFDGKIPKWFHFSCFFTKNAKIQSVSEIKHFDSLRWEDQEKIREHINPSGTPDPLPKFSVKLSSPVGQCSACKSELLKERHMIVADKRDAVYYHLSCFLRRPDCPADITTLTGFKKLKKVDRDAIVMAQAQASKENLKRPNSNVADGPVVKKPKKESDVDKKKEALRLQSKRLWTMHDKLETEVSKDALIGLLEYNDQHVPAGLSNLLDAVSDAMVFGALTTCPSCKNGPLRYSNGQYKCSAMATEWAPCLYHTRDPERKPFKVPEEYFDVEFLKNYKYVKRTRLFDAEAVPLGDGGLAGPFSGDMIFIDGGSYSNGKTKEQLATELKTLGASVKDRVEGCTLALTSRAGFEQLTSRVRSRLEELRIRVVSDEILSQFPDKTVAMSASRMSDILEKYTLSKWTPLISSFPECSHAENALAGSHSGQGSVGSQLISAD
ncbi:unnamed protein product [Calicophoron daubneyi]|uniref:NAD(+) ADP-ribosyltransferase n=1 Tax=Calicophoron daubneyi TaxID=300641 RepID=A0AAV2TKK3_CALDB